MLFSDTKLEGSNLKYDEVLLEKEGPLARITINREKALNALNDSVMKTLDRIFKDFEADEGIRVVIITGAGEKAFIAGADVKEIKEAGKGRTAFITEGQHILSRIRTSSKTVIAEVNGYALGGGCELALACDIRIASENAKFGLPEATLGVMAGYGGTQLLSRLIGPGKAKYMMFSGVILSAQEAFRFGLVEKVCARETLRDEVNAFASKIVSCGPLSIRGCKRAVDEGLAFSLEEALKFELELYDKVANSRDAEEGLSAFLGKRKPVFKGE
jgi:enoyl-CoA hydratase